MAVVTLSFVSFLLDASEIKRCDWSVERQRRFGRKTAALR